MVSPAAPLFSLPVLWWVLLCHCSHYLYYGESFCTTVFTTCTMVSPDAPLFSLPVLWWVLLHPCSHYLYYGESLCITFFLYLCCGEFWCTAVLATCIMVSPAAPLFSLPVLWWVFLHHLSLYLCCGEFWCTAVLATCIMVSPATPLFSLPFSLWQVSPATPLFSLPFSLWQVSSAPLFWCRWYHSLHCLCSSMMHPVALLVTLPLPCTCMHTCYGHMFTHTFMYTNASTHTETQNDQHPLWWSQLQSLSVVVVNYLPVKYNKLDTSVFQSSDLNT